MPNEPLVILHVALTNKLSTNITKLLKNLEKSEGDSDDSATHAIFYSISSCQKGLKNVDLGNSLIKNCVARLQHENPSLKHFHTLSPIPGFRSWLTGKLSDPSPNAFFHEFKCFAPNDLDFLLASFEIDRTAGHEATRLKFRSKLNETLQGDRFRSEISDGCAAQSRPNEILSGFLLRACAFYLYNEKQRGHALNSVCNFHVHNGAHIEQINLGANLSDRGWSASYGLMVNYGYNLANVDKNCLAYLIDRKIPVSESVESLLVQSKNTPDP